jgi:hypothetical protein
MVAMGFPLPTGTLYQTQHPWPGEEDYAAVSDAERMERQDRAYHGRFTKPLRATNAREPDHNVIDNRCEPIVATGVDFLLGDDVKFQVTDPDTEEGVEDAQQYLDDFWDATVKMPTMAEFEINCATFGHAFYKLIPDDPDAPLDEDGQPFPALSILNPMQMRVRTLPSDVRKVQRFAFTYADVDTDGSIIGCRQLTEKTATSWAIRDQIHRGGMTRDIAGAISLLNQMAMADEDQGWEDVDIVPWKYPWSPIHDSKNLPEPNSYLGKADLRLDIIHLNEALNFLLSNRQRILYYHGHPKDVFFGIHSRELDVTPAGAICIPNTNAKVQHIEMTGDLGAIENAIKGIREDMDELSHVPAVAVGRQEKLQPASGVALKVAYRPLISQTMQKRSLRQAMYQKLCQHVLELKRPEWGNLKITPTWPVMVPADELAAAQAAAIWVSQLGVSKDTAMQRLPDPFDPEVEDAKKQEEADEALANAAKMMAVTDPPDQPPGGPGGGNQPPKPGQPGQAPPGNQPPPAQKKPPKRKAA